MDHPSGASSDVSEVVRRDVDFLRDVRPILAEHCMLCHGPDEQEAGLRLDSREAATADLGGYAAVVPGDREGSELWFRINLGAGDSDRMPPVEHGEKLSPEQIETLGRWIDQGAPWQEHWAFVPWRDPKEPEIEGLPKAWREDPIDAFVAATIQEASLDLPSSVSDLEWLRRTSFDLTGLPPSVEEIEGFLAEEPGLRRASAADRLLGSPHYGERMARRMLDLMRYAESRGHEFDFNIPNAFEYRDYLIRAFNQDVGWDQLVREYIAGDLLPEPRLHPEDGFNESVIGTGAWHFGEGAHSPVDLEKDLADRTANQLEVFGKAFLGLTVSCARCHDHKFDPIPTRDYYALASYIQSASYRQVPFEVLEQHRRLRAELDALDREGRAFESEVLRRLDEVIALRVDSLKALGLAVNERFESRRDRLDLGPGGTDGPLTWSGLGSAFLDHLPNDLRGQKADTAAVGTLVSESFVVEHDELSFRIAGGGTGATSVSLILPDEEAPGGGEVLFTQSGGGDDRFRTVTWDLTGLHGRSVGLRIVDSSTEPGGFLACDSMVVQNRVERTTIATEVVAEVTAEVTAEVPGPGGPDLGASGAELVELATRWSIEAAENRVQRFQAPDGEVTAGPVRADGTSDADDVLTHFSAERDRGWLRQDGSSFVHHTAGQALLSADARHPVHAVLPVDAVVLDPDWRGFERDPKSESESVGTQWEGSGRTFRTRTVTLDDRPVWYLLRGRGVAFAPIEHHRLLSPPLHVHTAMEFDTGGAWRWVHHRDLGRYAGKRAHFEFRPRRDDGREQGDGVDLLVDRRRSFVGIAMVVQADEPPFPAPGPSPAESTRDRLLERPDLLGPVSGLSKEATEWFVRKAAVLAERPVRSRIAPALLDGSRSDEWVALRGDPHSRGEPAPRAFLSRFDPEGDQQSSESTSGRLALADSVLESAGPLVARVVANRLWQQMFGEPLVATSDNFGTLAAYPRDVDLLDHLAASLKDGGYRLKPILRRLVLSQAYAAALPPDASVALRSMPVRAPIRRLDAEQIRDALVAVTGGLDRTVGGPSVPVHLTDFMQGRGRPGSGPLDGRNRRALYLSVRRNFLSPFLLIWDFPQPGTAVGDRSSSNVPAQSLAMMNDPFVLEMARRFGERCEAEADDDRLRIDFAWRTAFGRAPTERETDACLEFLDDPEMRWPDLAHVLLQRKEFVHVR